MCAFAILIFFGGLACFQSNVVSINSFGTQILIFTIVGYVQNQIYSLLVLVLILMVFIPGQSLHCFCFFF
ncbi:hypothetical protein B0H14DRAFT_2747859, partial [Mycena olivaceomarginata]